MLKALNISKTYYTKGGASQKALNNVSVELNSKGLVFILGKSGSGKSTLLNILGGLDVMDEGTIEIKGKSSKEFTTSDFDSYRNTYLGFIFQDFNILKDFSVKENINLAYELQHKKADDDRLNEILKQVEMLEYKDRKPNELSGGQIQRVAIARALIKNPEIIMADEPTGSLDSETGKQVFKTLQNLAKEKLVLVVSHDREAAEEYADRIIELKDGKIISDQSKEITKEKLEKGTNVKLLGSKIVLKRKAKLNEKDLDIINKGLENKNAEISLSSQTASKFEQVETYEFVKTLKQKTKTKFEPFRLIKSKLPNKNAFKMGLSSLKHKKVKLVFTLFLTIVALTLFGLSNVLANFNVAQVSINSFKDSDYTLIPIEKGYYHPEYNYYNSLQLQQSHVDLFEQETDYDVIKGYYEYNSFSDMLVSDVDYSSRYYTTALNGFIEVASQNDLKNDFVGSFPVNFNEIIINNYLLEHFIVYGLSYYNTSTLEIVEDEGIETFNDVVNKHVLMKGTPYKIVGMVNYDLDRYQPIKEGTNSRLSMYEDIEKFLNRIIVKEGFNTNKMTLVDEFSFDSHSSGNKAVITSTEYEQTPAFLRHRTGGYTFYGQQTETSGLDVIVPANWFVTPDYDEETFEYSYNLTELDAYLNTTITMEVNYVETWNYINNNLFTEDLNIVGFITEANFSAYSYDMILSDTFFETLIEYNSDLDTFYTYLNKDATGDKSLFQFLENNTYRHKTSFSSDIYYAGDMFSSLQKVFLILSLVLCGFVSLMILNFITTSISYKRSEIGILRALGARKTDVFKVFYFEGLIMGVIDYVITMILVGVGVVLFNNLMQKELYTTVTLVNLSITQFVLVGLVCFGVIFISSLLPVLKISSKKPIDAIRGH